MQDLPSLRKLTVYVCQKPSRIFITAFIWGGWLLAFVLLPALLRGAYFDSLSFDLRDYLLRAFVVFSVVHLAVRNVSLASLFAVPPITFALWKGLDVYVFSEWYSSNFRVNLHELNAQLFVVPIQISVAIAGLWLVLKKTTRTTSRLFTTLMMWGSILSTFIFHLAIVEVSYKPIEAIYAKMLKDASTADDYHGACSLLQMHCNEYALGLGGYDELYRLDPQLQQKEPDIVRQIANNHVWISSNREGLISATYGGWQRGQLRVVSAPLPEHLLAALEGFVFSAQECPEGAWCAAGYGIKTGASEKLQAVIHSTKAPFTHGWIEALPGDGPTQLWLRLLNVNDDFAFAKLASLPLPVTLSQQLNDRYKSLTCSPPHCQLLTAHRSSDDHLSLTRLKEAGPQSLLYLYWVDKALSKTPTAYVDRPEFLRSITFKDGGLRITTSPDSFSDTTLNIKVTFNMIITAFSCSWLVLGVFLILFHSRRVLLRQH